MRFNEAIDQALAESVSRFSKDLDRSREMFVAILGHDLRNPLNTVLTASQYLLKTGALAEPQATMTERIVRSAKRMSAMTDDLLDFAQGRLGAGMPIRRQPTDLAQEAAQAIEEITVAHPAYPVQLETNGDLHGEWDGARLRQLLSNLLGNAIQYGARNSDIRLTLSGTEDLVTLAVHNTGATIPKAALPRLFDPFKRLSASGTELRNARGVGLGLYIAEQIVHAHGGTIVVTSSQTDGTIFTASLPRDGGVGAEPAVASPDTERSVQPAAIGAR
jgi:signal transduction histidine kinase